MLAVSQSSASLSNMGRSSRRNSSFYPGKVLDPLVGGVASEKLELGKEAVQHGGLGIITAAIFLSGEMAGSGVLALPASFVGTGGLLGMFLIVFFTLNAGFSGTRLGLCWVMLEERFPEFRGEVRDPYPSIAEKAIGKVGRVLSLVCISLTLYGGGCVFIVLISQLLGSLMGAAGLHLTLCVWMVIVAITLIPLTWAGTPKDFWPIAVGALITTCIACGLIITTCVLDGQGLREAFANGTEGAVEISQPAPTMNGIFKAFGSIMFAFAGASTFPTIQADMADRSKFNISALIAMAILFLIYFPMAVAGYYSLGAPVFGVDGVQIQGVTDNIVLAMSDGPTRIVVEVMLLLHLITAFPIITNPPAQFFEQILGIPSSFNWKRCAFRSLSVLCLLFIAETVPSFGAILDLVGASTVTLLTFVFPPFFYMRLCDASLNHATWPERKIPLWERSYCWVLIVVGLAGGCLATYMALNNIFSSSMSVPCYLMKAEDLSSINTGGGH